MNRWTSRLGAELDALAAEDREAYELGYLLVQDFVHVQNGHWKSMEGGPGQRRFERASPSLQARAQAMFRTILTLTTTEFEQGEVPPIVRRSPRASTPRATAPTRSKGKTSKSVRQYRAWKRSRR